MELGFENIKDFLSIIIPIIGFPLTYYFSKKNIYEQLKINDRHEMRKRSEEHVKNIRNMLSTDKNKSDDFVNIILKDHYYIYWLYASDELIKKYNMTIDKRYGARKEPVKAQEIEALCKELLLEIRKEIIKDTKLTNEDVRFLIDSSPDSFKNN